MILREICISHFSLNLGGLSNVIDEKPECQQVG